MDKGAWLKLLTVLLAFLTETACVLLGIFLPPNSFLWTLLGAIGSGILFVWALISLSLAYRFRSIPDRLRMRELYRFLLKKQTEIEKDYKKAEKSILRLEKGIRLLSVILFFIASAEIVFWVASRQYFVIIPVSFLALFIFLRIYGILLTSYHPPFPLSNLLLSDDYPVLYRIVNDAAKCVGMTNRKILIYLEPNGTCVAENKGKICIGFSPIDCSLLTKEELFSVLLHEFAHVLNVDTARSEHFAKLETRLNANFSNGVPSPFFGAIVGQTSFRIDIYRAFAMRYHEIRADEKVADSVIIKFISMPPAKWRNLGCIPKRTAAK